MRPYLAIIKDSFKAALASRVLYVLLGLIILFLLAIAPLHVRESLDTSIVLDRDVRLSDQGVLTKRMKEMLASDSKPMQRIWSQLPPSTQRKIDSIAETQSNKSGRINSSGLNEALAAELVVTDLNQMIKDPQFYRQQDWSDGNYNSETQNLLRDGADSLTVLQQQRLNRLLVSQSFGGMISTGSSSSLNFHYGPFDWSGFLSGFLLTNLSHGQFASQISLLISWFLDKIVLSIGLLVAILVTANIVPQTFEAGTLNLLLSKPVSRSGLFLAKFAGGCMFIALCALVLFVGLWIWMGIGLGIWDHALLLSIPLYVIVFAIYYSVSSLTGLVTRSTILSIIATALFWASCWSVGTLYGFFNGQMEASEISSVTSTAQGLLVSTGGFSVPQTWSSRQSEWLDGSLPALADEEEMQMRLFQAMGVKELPFPKSIGPVSTKDGSLTVYGRVLATDTSTHLKRQCFVANANGNFQRRGVFPSGAVAMFTAGDEVICVNSRGRFYRFDPDKKFDNANDRQSWFVSAGPTERAAIGNDRQVAVDDQTARIAIYNAGTVTIYALDEADESRNYKQVLSAKIDTAARKSMSCQLAWQGDLILLALGNGQVIFLDAASLETKHSYLPETRVAIDSISASPDGRWFSLLYEDETLRLFDAENPSIERAPIRGQGGISAVTFDASSMIVADRTDRVTEYSIDDFSAGETWSPSPTWMKKIWRYGVKPLYWAFPKPGEFYKVVAHLSSSNDSQHNPNVDLSLQPVRPNPWSPLASGLIFMALMLGISCFVFSRTDY